MIHNLCNIFDESSFDTFYKALIIESSQLPKFNHLTPTAEVLGVVNSLPSTFQAMIVPFIPEKFNLETSTIQVNDNKQYRHRLSFPLIPQDEALQALLETYNNKNVVIFMTRHSHSYLYGTSAQPLLFTYDELHAATIASIKGYNLSMSGETYGPPIYFAGKESEFPVIDRGLAFTLTGSL